MKKYLAFFTAAVLALSLTACDSGAASYDFEVDYGDSSIYSRADMDEAIELIAGCFAVMDRFELHNVRYVSDECNSEKNVEWLNSHGGVTEEFTQCIEFVTDFYSPAPSSDAWEPDFEYHNYQWWFGRTEGGEWTLVDRGY